MIHETINLSKEYASLPKGINLISYAPDNYDEFSKGRLRKAVIVLPGGGYVFLSDREAEPIALKLAGEDIAAFILKYSIGSFKYPSPLIEGYAAIDYVRKHADKYHVDVDHIAFMGFSAGGHMAASLGAHHKEEIFAKGLGTDLNNIKPNGLILSYPVITTKHLSHMASALSLTGGDKELLKYYSVEDHVDEDYPKTFIWTTDEDEMVDPQNTIMLMNELHKHKVSLEAHYYPLGNHGASLGNEVVSSEEDIDNGLFYIQSWIDLAINWVKCIL